MKKIIILVAIACLITGHLHAQHMLADSAWTTTSTEQVIKTGLNSDLTDGVENITISYDAGNLAFTNHSDPQKSFTIGVKYDKTELGVVYFEPERVIYSRVTVQLERKEVVVEKVDQSMICYGYVEITID
ncbi:MAG: hypothetical protein MI921_23860 [Cytophagales bacterium]|nr:hypothetical protein [Cytophagales bacterium]